MVRYRSNRRMFVHLKLAFSFFIVVNKRSAFDDDYCLKLRVKHVVIIIVL